MNFDELMAQMARDAQTIKQLTVGMSAEQASWKPNADAWSALGVIHHLYMEERGAFRARLADGLNLPDPVVEFAESPFAQDDLAEVTQAFMDERERSLAWLRGMEEFDWEVPCEVEFGQISAGDVMVAWAAHDILHMRQLVELHYACITRDAQPYKAYYAGEW